MAVYHQAAREHVAQVFEVGPATSVRLRKSFEMMTSLYEFRLDGHLTAEAREAFCDMCIEDGPAGATVRGEVIDESHLLGILAQCRTLGLSIVSAQRLPVSPHDPGPGRTTHSPW